MSVQNIDDHTDDHVCVFTTLCFITFLECTPTNIKKVWDTGLSQTTPGHQVSIAWCSLVLDFSCSFVHHRPRRVRLFLHVPSSWVSYSMWVLAIWGKVAPHKGPEVNAVVSTF